MPHHWHLVGAKRLKDGKVINLSYVVRDGYEDEERDIDQQMGYDVTLVGCSDHDHLGKAPR